MFSLSTGVLVAFVAAGAGDHVLAYSAGDTLTISALSVVMRVWHLAKKREFLTAVFLLLHMKLYARHLCFLAFVDQYTGKVENDYRQKCALQSSKFE